jgi:hypothetical protein
VTGRKKEKGERGRCWAAAANGPEEGAGPCGEKEREESCWAGSRGEGERFRGLESFVFFQNFSNLFKL